LSHFLTRLVCGSRDETAFSNRFNGLRLFEEIGVVDKKKTEDFFKVCLAMDIAYLLAKRIFLQISSSGSSKAEGAYKRVN
jgi:hypothetical protein